MDKTVKDWSEISLLEKLEIVLAVFVIIIVVLGLTYLIFMANMATPGNMR